MSLPLSPTPCDEFHWSRDNCEDLADYKPGGYHPVHLGDIFSRYRVMYKLGFGAFSTVWLARDLSEDHKVVALKINVARLSDSNNESRILQWLETQPLTHPGRVHILTLRDSFFIYGPNGKHEVLVTDVVLPLHQFESENGLKDHSKRICLQGLMGIAYLQEHNVSHGDLRLANLAISIPESQTFDDFMKHFWEPECIPVMTRDPSKDIQFLPKYLVLPNSILQACIRKFKSTPGHAICVKIMDLGNAFRPTDNRPPPCTSLKIRPPEVQLKSQLGGIIDDEYGLKSDIWSLGCTIHELLLGYTIFGSCGEAGLIMEMTELGGEPPLRWQPYWETILSVNDNDPRPRRKRNFDSVPHVSAEFNDGFHNLLRSMICLDPLKRSTASELLDHPWFHEV